MRWRRRRDAPSTAAVAEPNPQAAVSAALAAVTERQVGELSTSAQAAGALGDHLPALHNAVQDADAGRAEYFAHGDSTALLNALPALREHLSDPSLADAPGALVLPLIFEATRLLLAGYEAGSGLGDLRLAGHNLDRVAIESAAPSTWRAAAAFDSALGGGMTLTPHLERLAADETQHLMLALYTWWMCACRSGERADLEAAVAAGERAVAKIPRGDELRPGALAQLADIIVRADGAGIEADLDRAVEVGEQLLREVRGREAAFGAVSIESRRCRILLARAREVPRATAIQELAAVPATPGWEDAPEEVRSALEELVRTDDTALEDLLKRRPVLLDDLTDAIAADLQLVCELSGLDVMWVVEDRRALLAECRDRGVHAALDRLSGFDEELVELVWGLVGDRTPEELADLLRSHPELAGDDGLAVLHELISQYRARPSVPDNAYPPALELVAHARARSVEEACDFEVAQAALQTPDAVRARFQDGARALNAFAQEGDPALLYEALEHMTAAMDDPAFDDAPAALRSGILATACRCWFQRAQLSGDEADAARAIACGERAVAASRPAGDDFETALLNLGLARHMSFTLTGNAADLRAARDTLERALVEVESQLQNRAILLLNLGIVRLDLASELEPDQLAAAIDAYRESVRLTPDGTLIVQPASAASGRRCEGASSACAFRATWTTAS